MRVQLYLYSFLSVLWFGLKADWVKSVWSKLLCGLSCLVVAMLVSLLLPSTLDRVRGPRPSLSPGHVRVPGQGKAEGGLHHPLQLQQAYLHLQQSPSHHLKLTAYCDIVLSFELYCHLSLKNHTHDNICPEFHHEYVGTAVNWVELPRPVTPFLKPVNFATL